jgi:hypothetical protein
MCQSEVIRIGSESESEEEAVAAAAAAAAGTEAEYDSSRSSGLNPKRRHVKWQSPPNNSCGHSLGISSPKELRRIKEEREMTI